jgi:hypothetical protein
MTEWNVFAEIYFSARVFVYEAVNKGDWLIG